jgi:hypothetical protein
MLTNPEVPTVLGVEQVSHFFVVNLKERNPNRKK